MKERLELLRLAERLGNVSRACRMSGYSRQSFYRFRRLFDTGGADVLLAKINRRRPLLKNRVPATVEEAVVAIAFDHPTWGQGRVSRGLRERGIFISPSGVRKVWVRHSLETTRKRLSALESRARSGEISLNASHHYHLKKFRSEEAITPDGIPISVTES